VSNAGWGITGDLDGTSWSAEKDHLDIHVGIPLELVHRVLPGMVARGRGRVIVVSSVAAFLSRGTYSAAKRYWVTLARSLTASLRPRNVSVTAVCPGLTRTEFHQRMGMDISGFPAVAWLTARQVIAVGLRHSFRGQPVSVPSLRYRLLVFLSPLIPAGFHR
jgi:short-subunit dehydrogenase